MQRLTLCLTVIVSYVSIGEVYGKALDIDAKQLVQSLAQQLEDEDQDNQIIEIPSGDRKRENDYYADDDDDDEVTFGSLKGNDVERVFNVQNIGDDKQVYAPEYFDPELDQRLIEQLDFETQNKNNLPKKKQLSPNSLLAFKSLGLPFEDRDNDVLQSDKDVLDFSKYSNIYLILNPDAVKYAKNRDKVNDLLSVLLSSSKSQKKQKKQNRYRGFVVNEDYIKRRRMSQENSYERPSKGRRPRAEYGGGGNGSHTAIPYLHPRGDIYEKDNGY